MQLSTIPHTVIAINRAVVDGMAQAADASTLAMAPIASGEPKASVAGSVRAAFSIADDAVDGARELMDANVLDGTTHRRAEHALRQLTEAVGILDSKSPLTDSGRGRITDLLAQARQSARWSVEAGERSLANPSYRSDERVSSSASSNVTTSGPASHAVIDGVLVDNAGNPGVRGDGSWSGPDGQTFDSSGSPRGTGDYVSGPDGSAFSGI